MLLVAVAADAVVAAKPCNEQTPFQASLETAVQLMKSKVVQSEKHRVGVTFFGTKKTSDIDVSFARMKDKQQGHADRGIDGGLQRCIQFQYRR